MDKKGSFPLTGALIGICADGAIDPSLLLPFDSTFSRSALRHSKNPNVLHQARPYSFASCLPLEELGLS